MKIAFFSPEWPDGPNGIIPYVRHIGRALHELGHEVIVVSHHIHGRIGFERVLQIPPLPRPSPITRLARRFAALFGGSFHWWNQDARTIAGILSSLKKESGVDVFEMEETFGLCGLIADNTDVPVVVRLHGPYFLNGIYDDAGARNLNEDRLARERFGISRAAAVTSPSRQVLDDTLHYYGLSREGAVIPNPIPANDSGSAWSLHACERNTILFVGRTDSRKGGDLVIRVFERLLKQRPDLQLHFVGPDKGFVDADAGISIQDYLATRFSPEVAKHVTYHGPKRPAEIAAMRLKSHVTVVFSRYENFPTVCTEALAAGCPLVASRVGGIPEIVLDGETGLLAESEDVDDMASKIGTFLDNDELCVRLGEAGRNLCRSKLAPQLIANRSLEVYQRAICRS